MRLGEGDYLVETGWIARHTASNVHIDWFIIFSCGGEYHTQFTLADRLGHVIQEYANPEAA